MVTISERYTPAAQKKAIEDVYVKGFFEKRQQDFAEAIALISKSDENNTETENE